MFVVKAVVGAVLDTTEMNEVRYTASIVRKCAADFRFGLAKESTCGYIGEWWTDWLQCDACTKYNAKHH